MPIEAIYWDWEARAMEIHVLEGTTSPDLRLKLRFAKRDAHGDVIYPFAKAYLDDPANGADTTLSFAIADFSVPAGTSTRTFATHNITLDTTTGAVTVGTLTSPFPRNFLLEIRAVNGAQPPFKELIRVHVHRGIKDNGIWLTPNPLTVRAPRATTVFPVTTGYKFALRARFDDDVVGDITDWPGIAWTPAARVDDGKLKVNAGDAGGAPISISARLTAFPAAGTATANMRVEQPWGPANPINARLVPGGGWPNPFAIEAVPNVLFLPDGFPATAEADFYTYVNSLVAFLKTDPFSSPFDRLANSMNFWAAFIPSNGTGVTWGQEVFCRFPTAPTPQILTMPRPERPQDLGATDTWDVENLIYEVGVPLPTDAPTNTARTEAMIMAEWDTLFGSGYRAKLPTHATLLSMKIGSWRNMATRRILDDVDTPLGVISGHPRVDQFDELIDLNPHRVSRTLMEDLMSAIRHEDVATSGLNLGGLWNDPRKRDYDLVCLVTAGPGREINGEGFFMVAQQDHSTLPTGTMTGVNDIVPAPFPIVGTTVPSWAQVFVHELAHSFDLGDEYGGTNDRPLFRADQELSDRADGNLSSPLALDRGGAIHGEEIKWRWPRIRWAAEISAAVTEAGGIFTVPIRWSHSFAFPIDEIVHFRFRDIHFAYRDVHFPDQSSYLVKLPKVSVPLRLLEAVASGTPSVMNLRLRVDAAAPFTYPATSTITAANIIATFTPGCIVYCPRPAPPGAIDGATYPYAELIAKNVRDFITSTNAPVGRSRGDSGHPIPETPVYTGLTLPSDISTLLYPHIVALYEGGSGNSVGMFHPSGNCMMISQHSATNFCQVCQYILVDAIDPSKHYFIDPGYDEIYPQR